MTSNGTSSRPSRIQATNDTTTATEQQVDQRIGELGEELAPSRHRRYRIELVRPVARQPRRRLGVGQPAFDVRRQGGHDLGAGPTPRLGDCGCGLAGG